MITLARHPAVQQIIDEWERSLNKPLIEGQLTRCNEGDLRRLIVLLEEALAATADKLDAANSFKGALHMLWQCLRSRK